MPRSAADRAFGFRTQGLVRILTAADEQEVLEALAILGVVASPTGLFAKVRELTETFAGPAADALDVWRQLFLEIDKMISGFINFKSLSEAQAERAFRQAKIVRQQSQALDSDFRRVQAAQGQLTKGLDALEEQTEEDIALTFL